ncbi:hypothetical protein K505DRAFT_412592 [Melanomma pulvis-pyrius CBS 109.77]|uniref:Uncharacterized protein n=1 Tax=Melanomma pulvis-pyrius CBS 109.77 TaxID=1314802 RepID=A0A6A6XXH3_9PLEO|nr:hypothetical protein K505DRAFT_412592 [Melanomma pulvis-pyrius CBS 109.77]
MQFSTTLVSLVIAALSVQAMPATPVQERQSTPTIYARFYPDGGCHGDWVDDTVFVQSTTATTCVNNGLTSPYNSTFFSGNTATRTLRVFSASGCTGNYFDVLPGVNNCFAQHVGSSRFL